MLLFIPIKDNIMITFILQVRGPKFYYVVFQALQSTSTVLHVAGKIPSLKSIQIHLSSKFYPSQGMNPLPVYFILDFIC